MNKVLLFFCIIVLTICFSGCSSVFTPENNGIITGKLLYTTYVKVAANQDQDFKNKVESLWTDVNNINSTDDLNNVYNELTVKFNEILNSKNLNEIDKKLLKSVANDILLKVQKVINDNVFQGDGLAFLLGVREGVNSMIK